MSAKILPTVLILIDLGASVPYFIQGDWRRGIYWVAAAVLTTTVSY